MVKIFEAIETLRQTGSLPAQYRPHKLSGNREGQWECHIGSPNSDWLLIWEQHDDVLLLIMVDTGSHSDLF